MPADVQLRVGNWPSAKKMKIGGRVSRKKKNKWSHQSKPVFPVLTDHQHPVRQQTLMVLDDLSTGLRKTTKQSQDAVALAQPHPRIHTRKVL